MVRTLGEAWVGSNREGTVQDQSNQVPLTLLGLTNLLPKLSLGRSLEKGLLACPFCLQTLNVLEDQRDSESFLQASTEASEEGNAKSGLLPRKHICS